MAMGITARQLFFESLWQKKRVSTGALVLWGFRPSAFDPNENMKERLSSCRKYLEFVVYFVLMLSTNREIKNQIVVIQY